MEPDDTRTPIDRTGTPADDLVGEWTAMLAAADAPRAGEDRVLDQAGIDAALGRHDGGASAPAPGLGPILDPGTVRGERLPTLESVCDRAAAALATGLRASYQTEVAVRFAGLATVRVGDWLDALPLPALLGVFRVPDWDGAGLVVVETDLAVATLDRLLGGGAGSGSRIVGRPFSSIETQIVRRLTEQVLAALAQGFAPLCAVGFPLERMEANPRLADVARPGHAAVLASFAIDVDGRGGFVRWLLPHAAIEPVRALLQQDPAGERPGRDAAWEAHLASEIWQADLAMEAVLHETMLPLRRVMTLKVGDTLMFDAKPTDLVTVRCDAWALTQGRIGRVDDSIAVQITRPLRRPRTSLQAFEAANPEPRP